MPITVSETGKPAEWYQEISRQLLQLTDEIDITSTEAWSDLDALSSRTSVDDLVVSEDVLFDDDGFFFAPATIYVSLNYGQGREAFSLNESFLARLKFSVEDLEHSPKVSIIDVSVDTSPFFQ